MKIADFDHTHPSIVVIKVIGVEPTEAAFDEFLKEMSNAVNNAVGKIIIITDLTHGKFLPADLRIKMGNWYKVNDAILKEKVISNVLVNKSVIITVVMKGIHLINKPSIPTEIFSTLEQAMKWSEEKLNSVLEQ